MRYAIAAAVLALAMTGSGVMAADGSIHVPPTGAPVGTPPQGDADLEAVVNVRALEHLPLVAKMAVENSPVFDAASTTAPPPPP